MTLKSFHLRAATGNYRAATYQRKEYLVVPVTALVEGVIHPVNAPTPEFVPASSFMTAPYSWNGRPLFPNHPVRDGVQVPANSPEILDAECVGTVFNSKIVNSQLTMEAWIDPLRAAEVGGDAAKLPDRIKQNLPIEISVGAAVVTENTKGNHRGKEYTAIWRDIYPDHLALLPDGHLGACSIAMGCGVKTACAHLITAEGFEIEEALNDEDFGPESDWTEFRDLRNIPQSTRDKMSPADFAGPHKSFPIQEPGDVSAAAHALGRAKGNRDAIKRRIIAIAHRKGAAFVAQLPAAWRNKKSASKAASVFRRAANILGLSVSTEQLDDAILEAVIENFESSEGEPNFTAADAGQRTPCKCHQQGDVMNRAETIAALMKSKHNPLPDQKALEAASDESLTKLKAAVDKAEADEKAATDKAAADKAAADKAAADKAAADKAAADKAAADKAKTPEQLEAEYLANAPESVRTIVASHKAAVAAECDQLVAQLKTAQKEFSEEELKKMDLDMLRRLAKMNGATSIDFSLNGARHDNHNQDNVPPPPSIFEALSKKKAS